MRRMRTKTACSSLLVFALLLGLTAGAPALAEASSVQATSGDWNGDGDSEPGLYNRPDSTFRFFECVITVSDPCTKSSRTVARTAQTFGDPGFEPVIGDWDGDGVDTIGVYTDKGEFHLTNDASSSNPTADRVVRFGNPSEGDVPVVGDWDNDGILEVGVRRGGTWLLDTTCSTSGTGFCDAGGNEIGVQFGLDTDAPIVGDWQTPTGDEVGVFRAESTTNTFHVDFDLSGGVAEWPPSSSKAGELGDPGDQPVVGDWDGDGDDDIGVYRPSDDSFHGRPPLPPDPDLSVSGPSCTGDSSCSGPQDGAAFSYMGEDYTPDETATRRIETPTGDLLESTLHVAIDGTIGWDFTSSCDVHVGTYRIRVLDDDSGFLSNVVTQEITVSEACRPEPQDDSATTEQDTQVTIDVLSNDSDPNGDPLRVTDHDDLSVEGGSVSCSVGGSCTYTPPGGFTGPDSFGYEVTDDTGVSAEATVSITVGDGIPPDTFITDAPEGPPAWHTDTTATFAFSGSDNVTAPEDLRFECSLDGAAFTSCTSPRTYTDLSERAHRFQVRAVDEAENRDPTPATQDFRIDVTPPESFFFTSDQSVLVREVHDGVEGASKDELSGVDTVEIIWTNVLTDESFKQDIDCGRDRVCTWSSEPGRGEAVPGLYEVRAQATDGAGLPESPGPVITVVLV